MFRSQPIQRRPRYIADMVGRNVPLPTEPTEQILSTPTASAAVNIKNTATFDVRVMDDNDEPWATEADHRTGWNKTFKIGTYRGMLCGIVLRDYPKQVVSLIKSKERLHNHARVSLLAQRNYRTDVTASTVERKTGGLASAGAGPGGCKEFFRKGSNAHSIRLTCEKRHPQRQDPATCFHRHGPQWKQRTHGKDIVLIVELTLTLFRVRSSTLSRQHVQLLRIVMKNWQIGYRVTRRSRCNK